MAVWRSLWGSRRRSRGGFTLIDVLVTIGVVVLLIGIMLPGLGRVQEISRQVVCRSNLRQVGLGLALYADASRDQLPTSVFIDLAQQKDNHVDYSPEDMMILRLNRNLARRTDATWDGLGLLYETEMLPSQEVFYCPSHHGNYDFSDVSESWRKPPARSWATTTTAAWGPTGPRGSPSSSRAGRPSRRTGSGRSSTTTTRSG